MEYLLPAALGASYIFHIRQAYREGNKLGMYGYINATLLLIGFTFVIST